MTPSRRALVTVGVVAIVVRLVYVLAVRPDVPFVSDGQTYHLLADVIADGRGYIAPFDWFARRVVRPTAEFGPVHPTVLAVASLLGASSMLAHQVVLAFVGSVTPVLTTVLAGRITGDARIALASGLVAAVHPLLFGSDGAVMAETTYTLLGLLVVLLALRAASGGRWWLVATGAVLGLAVLTRGDGLLLLPFAVLPALLVVGWRFDRAVVLRVGLVAGAAALVVAPWMIRNAGRFDGRVILSNNVGSLLNGSNCPEAYRGRSLGSWDFRCAYRVELPGTDEAENAAVLRARGFRYARAHPGRWPVVVSARVGRAWGAFHPFGQARAEEHDGRVYAAQVSGVVLDWVLVPLFVMGVVALRRQRKPVGVLVGLIVMVTLLVAVTYGSSRFRQVAEPALVVGAVAGAASIVRGPLTNLTERR